MLAAIVHGLWDFATVSGSVVPDKSYPLGISLLILTDIILAVLLLVRRHHIELRGADRPVARPRHDRMPGPPPPSLVRRPQGRP